MPKRFRHSRGVPRPVIDVGSGSGWTHPRGPVAASKCFPVRADGSAASRPSHSSVRSCARPTRRAAAVNSCCTRPAPAAGSHTPLVAPPVCPPSSAAPSVSSPECNCARRTLHTLRNLRVGRHRVKFYAPNRAPCIPDQCRLAQKHLLLNHAHLCIPGDCSGGS